MRTLVTHPYQAGGAGRAYYLGFYVASLLASGCLAAALVTFPELLEKDTVGGIAMVFMLAGLFLQVVVIRVLDDKAWEFVGKVWQDRADEPKAFAVTRFLALDGLPAAAVLWLLLGSSQYQQLLGAGFAPMLLIGALYHWALMALKKTTPTTARILGNCVGTGAGVFALVFLVANPAPFSWTFYGIGAVVAVATFMVNAMRLWEKSRAEAKRAVVDPYEKLPQVTSANDQIGDEKTATDAVMVLEALARIMEASPHGLTSRDTEDQVLYVRQAASSVAREARLDPEELENARRYGGSEWDGALLNILFPADKVLTVFDAMNRRA